MRQRGRGRAKDRRLAPGPTVSLRLWWPPKTQWPRCSQVRERRLTRPPSCCLTTPLSLPATTPARSRRRAGCARPRQSRTPAARRRAARAPPRASPSTAATAAPPRSPRCGGGWGQGEHCDALSYSPWAHIGCFQSCVDIQWWTARQPGSAQPFMWENKAQPNPQPAHLPALHQPAPTCLGPAPSCAATARGHSIAPPGRSQGWQAKPQTRCGPGGTEPPPRCESPALHAPAGAGPDSQPYPVL